MDDGRRRWSAAGTLGLVLARGVALFLGGFALLNTMAALRLRGFDANLWWIDLRWLPAPLATLALLAGGALLAAFALRPGMSDLRRRLTLAATLALAAVALGNTLVFHVLQCRGRIDAGVPVAFSLPVALALLGIAWQVGRPRPAAHPAAAGHALTAMAFALCLPAFALGQMVLFGRTDYRRPADAVVVFGARVYADGRPSQAVADRVRTACDLYRQGLAPRLIMTGGPGDGPVHETEAMRDLAIRLGVPAGAIVLDRRGLNTQASVDNICAAGDATPTRRLLAVSHAYHLPRVKLTFARARCEALTVPARETWPLTQMPWLMAREVAALWVYYLRPLAG